MEAYKKQREKGRAGEESLIFKRSIRDGLSTKETFKQNRQRTANFGSTREECCEQRKHKS